MVHGARPPSAWGVIASLVALNTVLGMKHDARDNAQLWTTVEAAKARRVHANTVNRAGSLHDLREDCGVLESEAITRAIRRELSYPRLAHSSLPDFAGETRFFKTFMRTVVENHSWLSASAWGSFDPIVPRHIRSMVLAIEILWTMAANAVL